MKTIEEAMLRAWCEYRDMEYVEGYVIPVPSENFEEGFKAGANHIMSLPLATPTEEKLSVELTDLDINTLSLIIGDFLRFHYDISRNSNLEKRIHRDALNLKEKLSPIFDSTQSYDQSKGKLPYRYTLKKNEKP